MKTNLQQIPGVGKIIERDLISLGIKKVSELKNKNAQSLYEKLREIQGKYVDRCMLYVFRCAVDYVKNPNAFPKNKNWWHYKDSI